MIWSVLAASSAVAWCALLVVPWRPWRTEPSLDADVGRASDTLADVTAVVPARNEAHVLPQSLAALKTQGVAIVVVDDQSDDDTARVARAAGAKVVAGLPVPAGWSGKLWALEQGSADVKTDYVLLLDSDIALAPAIVTTLRAHMRANGIALASLVARPRLVTVWEKLLMPAFVYFFALLYPFRLSNSPRSRIAAASGGCVLVERQVLETIGRFAAIRHALIDDCAFAAAVKRAGFITWIGYTRSAQALRAYDRLADIWNMVARTAYTQLRYSVLWLFACAAIMALMFVVPIVAVSTGDDVARASGAIALGAMIVSYIPTLRLLERSPAWALALPLVAMLYLAMTFTSAARFYRGERARWKGRVYAQLE